MAPQPVPWTDIKALSFDIYGTLIDWETAIYAAFQASALGPHVRDRAEVMALMSRHERAVQAEHPTMRQRDVIAEGMRRAAAELGLVAAPGGGGGALTQAQVDASAREYGGKIGSYPAFADTVAAIRRLGARYRLVPLTNVDRESWAATLGGPLDGCRFDAVYTAEDIGSYKPDLRNFQYLMNHLKEEFGVGKEQLCHVAQSLHHDHQPAKDFGLPYHVWVDRKGLMGDVQGKGYDEMEINLRVQTLGELAEIVDKAFENKG